MYRGFVASRPWSRSIRVYPPWYYITGKTCKAGFFDELMFLMLMVK